MTIWDDIQHQYRVKLRRTDYHKDNSTTELRVLAQISQLMRHSLPHFVKDMQLWLRKTKMGNHIYFDAFYVLVSKPDAVEVWHRKVNRDHDRHVCTVHLLETETKTKQEQ